MLFIIKNYMLISTIGEINITIATIAKTIPINFFKVG
jgi:hypothetical protein